MKRCIAAGALALSLGLAACGSSSTSSTPTTAAGTRAPTVTSVPPTTTAAVSTPATIVSRTTTMSVPTPHTLSAPGCTTSNLRLSFSHGVGAGGTSYSYYHLTNVGKLTCSMVGYPGVSILDAQGRIVQKPAVRSSHPGTTTPVPIALVTLHPGRFATFVLASTDNIPNPDCPTAYAGQTVQVYPPNQTAPILKPNPATFCDLVVGPVFLGT
jgi:hypothetical protein